MRLLINANVFGWRMTGLMPKSADWFIGFSRRPKEIQVEPRRNFDGDERYCDIVGNAWRCSAKALTD